MIGKLERLSGVVLGSSLLIPVYLVAQWYRSDSVFSSHTPFTFDWWGTWFVGVLAGLFVTTIAVFLVLAIAGLAVWVWKGGSK